MSFRRLRSRLLDLTVVTVSLACVLAPFLPSSQAATQPSLVEGGTSVGQRVLQAGVISHPLNGTFGGGTSGQVDGSVQWDMYSTASTGIKLVVASDRNPAMRDAANGVDIADYASQLSSWDVTGSDRRFGFSARGALVFDRFDDGTKWRGFDGKLPVDVARRRAPLAMTRSTVKLRAEFGSALAGDARPTTNIEAMAVMNL
jgi:hypothetical protein